MHEPLYICMQDIQYTVYMKCLAQSDDNMFFLPQLDWQHSEWLSPPARASCVKADICGCVGLYGKYLQISIIIIFVKMFIKLVDLYENFIINFISGYTVLYK